MTVRVLEKLVKPRAKRRTHGEQADAASDVESKWVDLLIKSYVKVGRVGDAVLLTDEQLARIDSVKEPFVHARVALTVFPWRYGSAVWKNLSSHYKQLVRASELSLQLSPKEVEGESGGGLGCNCSRGRAQKGLPVFASTSFCGVGISSHLKPRALWQTRPSA